MGNMSASFNAAGARSYQSIEKSQMLKESRLQ